MRLNEREENEENASRRVPNFDGTNWDEFELKMMFPGSERLVGGGRD